MLPLLAARENDRKLEEIREEKFSSLTVWIVNDDETECDKCNVEQTHNI